MHFYFDIRCHKTALRKHAILSSYAQVLVKVVRKVSCLIHTERKYSSCTERRIPLGDEVYDVVSSNSLEIFSFNFSTVEKKFSKRMALRWATRSPAIHFAITSPSNRRNANL